MAETTPMTELMDKLGRKPADEAAMLRRALQDLYDQVCSLEDYTTTRDIERHKAEACFDYAVEQARLVLKRTANA